MTDSETNADAPAVETPPVDPTHALLDAWFAQHFHNSVVARDTEIFNHVHAAKEDLKRLLTEKEASHG